MPQRIKTWSMVQEQIKLLRLQEQTRKRLVAAIDDAHRKRLMDKLQLIARKLADLDTGESLQTRTKKHTETMQEEPEEAESFARWIERYDGE